MISNNVILECLGFVALAIKENDLEMARNYYEQLNDLMINYLGEEKWK